MKIEDNLEECRNSSTRQMPKKILYEVVDMDIQNGIFEMPKEVYEVGKLCFYNCKSLKKVIFPDFDIDKRIVIGPGAFYQTSIEEFVYKKDIIFNYEAFRECSKLKTVILLKGMSFICDHNINPLFADCISLEFVDMPNMENVPSEAFKNCVSLKKIKLSKQLKEINSYSFQNCKSLTNLVIPSSINFIDYNAFDNCPSLDLVIESSLFWCSFKYFKSSFDVKSLTIYNNKIDLDDSVDDIERKIDIIRRKEIETIIRGIFEKNNCNFYDIDKQDLNKIQSETENLLKEIKLSKSVSYNIEKFESEITNCLKKYIKNLPILKQYTFFIGKTREEIYNIINNFNPNLSIKTIYDIQKYGNEILFFPTYIMGTYFRFVQIRNDYSNAIIKMKDILDRLVTPEDKRSFIKKLFFHNTNNSGASVELNTKFIDDLSNFIDRNEVNLIEELNLLEELKKLLLVFLDKLQKQIQFIRDYHKDDLTLDCQMVLSEKLTDLEISLLTMNDLNDKIGILGASNMIIYNKIELIKNTILPKLLLDCVLNGRIEKNEKTIETLNKFSVTLEEIIIENEKNRELLQLSECSNNRDDNLSKQGISKTKR